MCLFQWWRRRWWYTGQWTSREQGHGRAGPGRTSPWGTGVVIPHPNMRDSLVHHFVIKLKPSMFHFSTFLFYINLCLCFGRRSLKKAKIKIWKCTLILSDGECTSHIFSLWRGRGDMFAKFYVEDVRRNII